MISTKIGIPKHCFFIWFSVLYFDEQKHNYFTNYHTTTCCFLCFLNFIPTFFPLHSLFFLLYSFMFNLPDSNSPSLATLLTILSFILFILCSPFVCSFYTFSSFLYYFPLPPGPLLLSLRLSFLTLSSLFYSFLFSSCSPQTVELQGSSVIGTDIHVTFKYALFGFLEYTKAE